MDDPKKANYAVQMMRDSKFNFDIKRDIKETTKLYEICARQYSRLERQKSDLFIHAIEGSDRRFFLEKTNLNTPFRLMSEIMESEYYSDVRKLQVKATV